MDFYLEALSDLIRNLSGLEYYGYQGLVVLGLFLLIFYFLRNIHIGVKLFVVILLIGFLAVVNGQSLGMARTLELKQIPDQITHQELIHHQTGDEVNSVVIAPGMVGWIHCGDFNSTTQFWEKRYINIEGQSSRSFPAELEGQSGYSPWALDFFDSLPEFSSFELKWEFGNFQGTLRPYDAVKILDFKELGQGRVWCQVQTIV